MPKIPRQSKPAGKTGPAPNLKDLPDPATVVSEATLTSPKGTRFRILRTTQKDPYDRPADKSGKRRG